MVVPAWLVILAVQVAVALSLNPSRADFEWFLRLRRPMWLRFERWIPLIWLLIYACFYASALLSWQAGTGGWSMVAFLVLLLLVQGYTWLICRTRRLSSGTTLGFLGWTWGVGLALGLTSHSLAAAGLLIPYLLWSPVGTFVTWQMERLNR